MGEQEKEELKVMIRDAKTVREDANLGYQRQKEGEEEMKQGGLAFEVGDILNEEILSGQKSERILSRQKSEQILSSQKSEKILSRQKRQFPIFGFLSFLMLMVNSVMLINTNININNNNNNNNMNMNINGRRLFKMLEDFAYNVAENFGIASEGNAVDFDNIDQPLGFNSPGASPPALVSQIGSQTPLFGRLDTLYKPARPSLLRS